MPRQSTLKVEFQYWDGSLPFSQYLRKAVRLFEVVKLRKLTAPISSPSHLSQHTYVPQLLTQRTDMTPLRDTVLV